MQSRGRLYPVVRGIAQAAVYHPHGGGRHQHIGHPSSVARNTPPGAKVGNIAPKKNRKSQNQKETIRYRNQLIIFLMMTDIAQNTW